MKILITGGCGFLGSNLAAEALKRQDQLFILDNLSRKGSSENLKWLKNIGDFSFTDEDIRNKEDIKSLVNKFRPDAIFHLAGQVAMTTSIENPTLDFEVNVAGTHNLLEAIRIYAPDALTIYSSTNKVYGDLEQYNYSEQDLRYTCLDKQYGFNESTQLDFHSPYGCSKGAADQYMLDYARIFGLKTIVFRHSSMYGGRQFATYDQGWIGWFCQKAIDQQNGDDNPFTIAGNGKQVRDVLFAKDMVRLYFKALEYQDSAKGQAFNIGGGVDNSLSLLELFSLLEELIGVKLRYKKMEARTSDQKVFIADLKKVRRYLNWEPEVDKVTGIKKMLNWLEKAAHSKWN